jgi:Protein of unknown function (DUF998)
MAGRLAVAGIVGPTVFMVVLLGQDLVRSNYDLLASGPRSPRAEPDGWVQSMNFVVLGSLVIAFAVALREGVRAARPEWSGPAILAWVGVALVFAGALPQRADGVGCEPNVVYGLNKLVSFGPASVSGSWCCRGASRLMRDGATSPRTCWEPASRCWR